MPTGGAAKHKTKHRAKPKTLEALKKDARRLGVPMSSHGHPKTKAQLSRAVSAAKHK